MSTYDRRLAVLLGRNLAIDGVWTASASLVVGRGSRNWAAPVKATRQKTDEERQAKLDLVRDHVDSGSLVIRWLTRRAADIRPGPVNRNDAERDDDAGA